MKVMNSVLLSDGEQHHNLFGIHTYLVQAVTPVSMTAGPVQPVESPPVLTLRMSLFHVVSAKLSM